MLSEALYKSREFHDQCLAHIEASGLHIYAYSLWSVCALTRFVVHLNKPFSNGAVIYTLVIYVELSI